jgi:hypothetical protein
MARARRRVLAAIVAGVAVVVAGCGGTRALIGSSSGSRSASAGRVQSGRFGAPAAHRAVAVISGWSQALRRGDVQTAARYFQIPSVFADGPGAVTAIHSHADAVNVNEALPCGARLISASQHGPYVDGLFRLTGRTGPGGSTCGSGAGQTARTFFLIRAGHIVQWVRAPDEPGDNGTPTTPSTPSTPGTPGTPGTPTTPTAPSGTGANPVI